jgi:hypothetical protein
LLNVVTDFHGGSIGIGVAIRVMGWWWDEEGVEVAEEAVDSHGFELSGGGLRFLMARRVFEIRFISA